MDEEEEDRGAAAAVAEANSSSAPSSSYLGEEDSRLVDYFVLAGYDHGASSRERQPGKGDGGFHCQGRVLQRFPAKDWKDTPFIEGLEHFCQPSGWMLRAERDPPKFFVAVLTDINGRRHYCAVLAFSEAVDKALLEPSNRQAADEELEEEAAAAEGAAGAGALASIVVGGGGGGGGPSSRVSRTTSLPRHVVPGVSLPTNGAAVMFAPKCLVLVSRHDLPDVLRSCLRVIYTAYSECLVGAGGERVRLERLVGNLLGSVFVPLPGGPQLRFSLGAGDRMALQPTLHPAVPRTGDSAAVLFRQLGVRNVLALFCACMTELKVLLYSCSFARLSAAARALVALMFPMRYSHVFIPVLPSSLLEVLATPTPFVIGVSSTHEPDVADLLDVITVDLDGGAITVPENMTVPSLPPRLHRRVTRELTMVLHPELSLADDAFPELAPSAGRATVSSTSGVVLDKELRAVMLRLMVRLLAGYRECLTLVRIHPRPYITFHKAAFLGLRSDLASPSDSSPGFARRLLDCMFFNTFVAERGLPWRRCDVFDDAYATAGEQLLLEHEEEEANVDGSLRHIRMLAEELYRNENPLRSSTSNSQQRTPQPAEGAMSRVHQPVFPLLEGEMVEDNVQRGLERFRAEKSKTSTAQNSKRLVPMGRLFSSVYQNGAGSPVAAAQQHLPQVSARRLEVLRRCIASIFENKISDAKKTFPAVISALKARQARLALCRELKLHKGSHNQVLLEHQQFDMVVRLMNAALQDDSDIDEHGVALALLPLSAVFGRKLAKGVIQFAYTVIQDHAVWQNQQFWEASFFNDVQKGIKTLYLNLQDQNSNSTSPNQRRTSAAAFQPPPQAEKSVLELAARETRSWESLDSRAKEDRLKAEEQTVYSEVFVYVNYMIYLLCPLDLSGASAGRRSRRGLGDDYEAAASNSISNSMAESDSVDAESGFEDQEIPDSGQQVIKQVSRFADKVCSEASVTEEHVRQVNNMVPTTVALYLEVLEAVATQANRLPPIQKPKINFPSLLPGEELAFGGGGGGGGGLRVYLLADGRREEPAASAGVALLPAEGALFLTNYRLIFKGSPVDPLASEHTVTRFFPVASLTKEKRFSANQYLDEVDQMLKEGIQLRSNTFQLIKTAFDDEVTADEIEAFKRAVQRVQFPEHLFQFFAFRDDAGAAAAMQEGVHKMRDAKAAKYSTIRGFASKTLKNVGRVAGYQPKKRKTSSKYLFPNVMPTQGRLSIAEITNHPAANNGRIREEDETSEAASDMQLHPPFPTGGSNNKTLERLADRIYLHDWKRQGIVCQDYVLTASGKSHYQVGGELFRVTTLNCRYGVVPSYPALMLVPARISDDSLRRYARYHKHSRFPTVTWRHPRSHALLLRGSGFQQRGVMGMIKRHHQPQHQQEAGGGHGGGAGGSGGGGQAEVASSIEAEMYTAAVIQVTPRSTLKTESAWKMSGSELSINSLVAGSAGAGAGGSDYSAVHTYPTLTPNTARKFNPLAKAMGTLTRNTAAPSSSSSSGAAGKLSRLSLTGKGGKLYGSQTSLTSVGYGRMGSSRYSERSESDAGGGINSVLHRTALYFFLDRTHHARGVKLEAHPKTEFIPLDYPEPRRLRASFKKLMRACVPSALPGQPDHTFLKQVEASEWLAHLQSVMQAAGAVVDLLDIQHASVSLCLEDGWDVTCQISSLAQLCLDPYYRTLEGFRVLVEKEWLSLGHRFHHRGNLASPGQGDAGFTPVFLQFLDAVHQIHCQFPMAFEFNQFYVRFLAYHHVSCRFRTFLLDCELQRHEVGLLTSPAASEKNGSFPRHLHGGGGRSQDSYSSDEEINYPTSSKPSSSTASRKSSSGPSSGAGVNVFDYIALHACRSPIFHNSAYSRELGSGVLRPFSHVSDLRIWKYFTSEELRHGPAYDIELRGLDLQEEEEDDLAGLGGWKRTTTTGRRTLTSGYDDLFRSMQDDFARLLSEAAVAEADLGRHAHAHWRHHWSISEEEVLARLPPFGDGSEGAMCPVIQTTPSITAKYHGRLMHKRSTMELILRGRMGGGGGGASTSAATAASGAADGSSAYGQSHRFEKYNYSTPTSCDVCNSLLWGPVRTGLKCADCGYNCHEKCRDGVARACSRYRTSASGLMPRDSTSENLGGHLGAPDFGGASEGRRSHEGGIPQVLLPDDDDEVAGGESLFRQFDSPASGADDQSQIICQGYLHKQANFKIKGWKLRWFVLDATKHQLRYYDTREDFHCRGHVDLSEVTRVAELSAGGGHGHGGHGHSGMGGVVGGAVAANTPGAPRKSEDGCFFELHTLKRTYCFCAESRLAALDWINKIQSCLS